jgi:phage terminase large subunit GpA-like protein
MLKTFTNTTLGMAYEEPSEKTDEHALKARAEPYRLRAAPAGVLVCVAGVDVQDDRWEVAVWGYGRGCESWLVDYTVIPGNPADERDWTRLDDYLMDRVPHSAVGSLALEAVAVDTGGHFTHQTYNFCRARVRRRVFAVKGDNKAGQKIKGKGAPQDVNFRGKIIKGGVKLYMVGTDTAKDLLFGRLRLRSPGPGYVHFSDELDDDFYLGLTAENRVKKKTARGYEYAWVPMRPRNEPLDCTVYAMFCASAIGLDVATEARWRRMEDALKASAVVVPAAPAPVEVTVPQPAMQKFIARPQRGGNWVRGFRP